MHRDAARQAYGSTLSTVPPGFSHSVIAVSCTTDFAGATHPAIFHDTGSGIIDSPVVTGGDGANYPYYKDHASGRPAGAPCAGASVVRRRRVKAGAPGSCELGAPAFTGIGPRLAADGAAHRCGHAAPGLP